MSKTKIARGTIKGVGHYVPEKKVSNQYFNELYKKDIDSFLRERRNIYERYFMAEDQATSDLIVPAAKEAIKSAGLIEKDIDLIVVATDTPDYISPSTASVVQYKLGIPNAGIFDINTACSGFVTALDVANKFIVADEQYNNILVVGAYGMSKFLDWEDYKIASMFADGAGAVVLSRTEKEDEGLLSSTLYGDGQYHDYMGIYAGGTFKPTGHEEIEKKENLLNFAKRIPLETNEVHWPRMANLVLKKAHLDKTKINHFFLTQLNIETINAFMDSMELDRELSYNVMNKFGYTGSACIPMALSDAFKNKKIKKGDTSLLIGSGGGMSMAALVLRWGIGL